LAAKISTYRRRTVYTLFGRDELCRRLLPTRSATRGALKEVAAKLKPFPKSDCRPDRMLSVVALAFDYGVGRTYIIYYFAPAVIVIRFKTLNNNKNQLLTRTFSTTFFKEEFRNNRPSPAILSGRLTRLREDDDFVCRTSFLRNGAASA
jgi:hypothetical protein